MIYDLRFTIRRLAAALVLLATWHSPLASGAVDFVGVYAHTNGAIIAPTNFFAGNLGKLTNALTAAGWSAGGGGGSFSGTATNLSGGALNQATNAALAVVAPWTNQVTGAAIAALGGLTNLNNATGTNVFLWAPAITNSGSLQPRIYFANGVASGWLGMSAGGYALYVNGQTASLSVGQIYSDNYGITSDGSGNLTAVSFAGGGSALTGITAGQISGLSGFNGAFTNLAAISVDNGYFTVATNGACMALSIGALGGTIGGWKIANTNQLTDTAGIVTSYSYADGTGMIPPANTILSTGVVTNQINSVSGVITNAGLVWFAVATNGAPNFSAPSGSICTTTNGQMFVRSNSVWLLK